MDVVRFEFTYLNDQSEFGVFALSGLAIYIDPAIRILHSRLEINPHLDYEICLNVGRESFSPNQKSVLDSCLKDVLNLITKYAKTDPQVATLEQQNYLFRNGSKYDNFVDDLISAIEYARSEKLKKSLKNFPISPEFDVIKQMVIENVAEREELERLQNNWVESARKRIKDFRYGKNFLSEKEVRAIGVLYAIEIILDRWRTQQRPISEYEILKFSGAVSKVQKLFNFRNQYISSIIGGMQKNDHFARQRELVQAVIAIHPSAKPKQLRELVKKEAEKRGLSENMIPPDSTLDRWFREMRLEIQNF